MEKLTDLPNIGKETVQLLNTVGITSPNDLVNLGSQEAWLKTREVDPGT